MELPLSEKNGNSEKSGPFELDSSLFQDKYPLPPIEKFDPDDAERAKPNDSDTVNAFGEDLAPARFIDDVSPFAQRS